MEKQLYNKISAAKLKYGEQVYNKTIAELRQEFGEDAFPVWISRFNYLNQSRIGDEPASWKPDWDIPDNHEEIQLLAITESFCHPNQELGYSNSLTTTEKDYFKAFSDALRFE